MNTENSNDFTDQTVSSPSRSTGPRTESGRATSSKNALKHGSCSTANLILERESIEDFQALEKRWFHGYSINPDNPVTEFEADLIRAAVRADWFFQRSERNYVEAEANIIETTPNPLDWSNDQHNALQRFLRYRTANLNILTRQRKAIEDYRKNRATETARVQDIGHKAEKMFIAREKLEIYREKNRPEPTFTEEIEEMTREAERLGFRNPDGTPTGKK
jgi:hypothetical protein